MIWRNVFVAVLFLSLPLTSAHAVVTSSITTDGTLGTTVTQTGKVYDINGGTIKGTNQFHSFGQFSVGTGDTASFSGPSTILNILSRVTGGQQSQIDGTIKSTIAGANLYLMNPAGVLFGPNASLDLSGSFHVTTADYLRLTDNVRFNAAPATQDALLSTAPVAAFGFLGTNPGGTITINGGTVANSQPLTIVGRDLTSEDTTTPGITISNGILSNPSGRINLISVGVPADLVAGGEVVLGGSGAGASLTPIGFSSLGTIMVSNAFIITDGNPGGTVYVRGGRLVLDASIGDSVIISVTKGPIDHPGVGVDVDVIGEVRLTGGVGRAEFESSTGFVDVQGNLDATVRTGNAGDIKVKADTVRLTGDPTSEFGNADIVSNSYSGASGTGHAGTIDIQARQLIVNEQAFIQTTTFGPGAGGTINVKTHDLSMAGAQSYTFIAADTDGEGAAGRINITADSLTLTGGRSFVGIASQVGVPSFSDQYGTFKGNPSAGDIEIQAGTVNVLNGAQISTGIFRGSGQGGLVQIHADSIFISGKNENGRPAGILTATETRNDFPSNFTVPSNTGRGGDIQIVSNTVEVTNSAQINAGSNGAGAGGSISIDTKKLDLSNAGKISAASSSQLIGADAGSINIKANEISLATGASISSGSLRQIPGFLGLPVIPTGNGGNIILTASQMTVDGSGTSITAISEGIGNGGAITANLNSLTLANGAQISSSSTSTLSNAGSAGNIRINAADRFVSTDSAVTTQATQADGGNIDIHVGNLVRLINSSIATSVGTGTGNGGNISIDPNFVILDHSQIVANAFGGNGGNITITSGVFLVDPSSIVSASSALGVNGTIQIQSPVQNLSGTLSPLPSSLLKIAPLTSACAARAQGGSMSSFTVAGRDGVPAEPGGLLPSPLQQAGLGSVTKQAATSSDLSRPLLLSMNLESRCAQ